MNPWFSGALRWADQVDHACGVLLASGVALPDAALEALLAALLPDGERLGAGGAVARIATLQRALGAVRAAGEAERRAAGDALWAAVHALLGWTARYRREIQHASLRATLTRSEVAPEALGADADLVVVGILRAGRRWFAHGRFVGSGAPVVLVDEVRGEGWNVEVISALFQARITPADVWTRVLRLPAGHPTEVSGGRVLARPAFTSRPQVVVGALRPKAREDAERGRVHARRAGDEVSATMDRAPVALGDIASWNLWKAAGEAGWTGWGWVANGVLIGIEGEIGPLFVAVDPGALAAADFGGPGPPADLGPRVAAALGGSFAAAWRDPVQAWEQCFVGAIRDPDLGAVAGRLLALAARGGAGVEEGLASALGRVARGEGTALEVLALDLAATGTAARLPPERLRQLARFAADADRDWVRWLFARAGRAEELEPAPP